MATAARRLRSVGVAAAALGALLRAPAAGAWEYAGSVGVAVLCPREPTPVRVEREDAAFDCTASDASTLRCNVRVLHVLRNSTDHEQRVTLVLPAGGEHRSDVRATSDDGTVARAERSAPAQLTVTIAPGATREVALRETWTLPVERRNNNPWGTWNRSVLGSMHPLFEAAAERTLRASISLQRAAHCQLEGRPSWGGVGVTTMTTSAPPRWRPTAGWEQRGLCHEGSEGLACRQVESVESIYEVNMSVDMDSSSAALRLGGPVVGVGGTSGQGFRARIGYEAGVGRLLLGSVTLDGDTGGNVILGAMVGLPLQPWGTWHWRRWWRPAGVVPWLGAVVGVVPDSRVGARAQVSLAGFIGGLDVGVDYWPVDGRFDVTVLLRAGL